MDKLFFFFLFYYLTYKFRSSTTEAGNNSTRETTLRTRYDRTSGPQWAYLARAGGHMLLKDGYKC